DRRTHGVDQGPRLGEEHVARALEGEREPGANLFRRDLAVLPYPRLDLGSGVQVVVANVEVGLRRARYHVGRRVRHGHDRGLQARGLEMLRALVEWRGRESVDDARELRDGVLGTLA